MTQALYRWLGHSSVLLPGPPAIAIDPWRWRSEKTRADLVLVTHGHADHCSEEDLVASSHEATWFVSPEALAPRMRAATGGRVLTLTEGASVEVGVVRVLGLPAEGPVRAAGFHPRGAGLSYLVQCEGLRYLHLGDSRALPEHSGLAPDVAFLPVGGLAVMDPEEAADAAAAIRPALAVPVHWGDLNGRFDLAVRFATLCAERGIRAETPTPKE